MSDSAADSLHGWRVVCGVRRDGDIFEAIWLFQWRCSTREILAFRHRFERSSNMCSRIDWRVSIVGSQANDEWEMKIVGPNAFERSYALERSAGEHRPEVIRVILGRMLPGRKD
jgi:hypothetical protein